MISFFSCISPKYELGLLITISIIIPNNKNDLESFTTLHSAFNPIICKKKQLTIKAKE